MQNSLVIACKLSGQRGPARQSTAVNLVLPVVTAARPSYPDRKMYFVVRPARPRGEREADFSHSV